MRLLELPESILEMLTAGEISAGHARALLPIGEEQVQLTMAKRITEETMSVRATENAVSELLRAEEDSETGLKVTNKSRQKRKPIPPHIEAMQQGNANGVRHQGRDQIIGSQPWKDNDPLHRR